jgi:outer membrane protein assembly factor BamB
VDGTLYVAVGAGPAVTAGVANAIVALEPMTLKVKDSFTLTASTFETTPIVVQVGARQLVVAATRDGRIVVLDSGSLGGADHKTPLVFSPPYSSATSSYAPAGVASWQDANGVRWLLLPTAGRSAAAAGIPASNGPVTSGAIVALRLEESGGTVSLKPGWVSRDLVSPWTPIVVNGVVFALSSGAYQPVAGTSVTPAVRASRSVPAVLYALDSATGAAIWNSGRAMTRSADVGNLLAGNSQIHVVTSDYLVYAFGFAMERR